MRKLVLNGWNLLLVVILVTGLLACLSAAVASILPALAVPSLVPIGILITIEALTTQRIAVEARLSWSDQGRLRGLEWALLLVLIRFWALLTDGRAVIEQVTPWLRDPIAFFTQQYMIHVVLAFVTWSIATALGHQVLLWSAEIIAVPRLDHTSIERSHVDAEQTEAVRRFDSQLVSIVTLTLLLALFALRGEHLQLQLLQPRLALTSGAALATVLVALLLHSSAHLRQITDGWLMDGAQIEPGVIRNWQRMGMLVLAVALLLGPLLGPLALLVPAPPLVPVINAFLIVATLLGTAILFILALIITPFAWLLSLLQGKSEFKPPTVSPLAPPQLPVDTRVTERPLAPGLIFWSCLILLLGIALVRYLQQRDDLFHWLRRWPAGRWLLRMWSSLWHDATDWATLVRTSLRARLRRVPRTTQRRPRPRGVQGHLRALYQELVRAGEAQGVAHPPAATPFEYSTALGTAIPPVEPDVAALTELYVRAEYGPALPNDADLQRGQQRWRRIQRWLSGTKHVVHTARQAGRLRIRPRPKR